MKLICISDTHGRHSELGVLPDGDVLIHCGDFSSHGTPNETHRFLDWFEAQPHQYKILIAGNHDCLMDDQHEMNSVISLTSNSESVDINVARSRIRQGVKFKYLQEESIEIEGVRFYGAPYVAESMGTTPWAFGACNDLHADLIWSRVPNNIDILITHGPPYGILDKERLSHGHKPKHIGCDVLLMHVKGRIKPRYHLFGHCHGQQGVHVTDSTTFMNVTSHGAHNMPLLDPVIINLPPM